MIDEPMSKRRESDDIVIKIGVFYLHQPIKYNFLRIAFPDHNQFREINLRIIIYCLFYVFVGFITLFWQAYTIDLGLEVFGNPKMMDRLWSHSFYYCRRMRGQ